MESLAKIVALYLKVVGGFFMISMLCMGVWAMFQPNSHDRLKAEMNREQSPVFYMNR